MTLREFLTTVLQRIREMEAKAKNEGNYASALKKQGATEEVETIYFELNRSRLFDEKI